MKNKSASPSVLIGLFVVLVVALYSSPARASTVWTGNGDGHDWFNGNNWDPWVPSCSIDASISNGGKAEIGLPGAMARTLTVGGTMGDTPGSGTLSVDGTNGGALSVGERGGTCAELFIPDVIYVGLGGSGTLSITNGGEALTGSGAIAVSDGSNGAVTVDGANSKWTIDGRLYLGVVPFSGFSGGTAVLNVTNGGVVEIRTPGPLAYVGTSGTLMGNGTVTMIGTGGSRMEVRGTVAPTGTLQFNGNLSLIRDQIGESTMLCHVTPEVQSRLNIVGTAALDGRLIVILSGQLPSDPDCSARITLLHAVSGIDPDFPRFHSVSIQGIPPNGPYIANIEHGPNNVDLVLRFVDCEPLE